MIAKNFLLLLLLSVNIVSNGQQRDFKTLVKISYGTSIFYEREDFVKAFDTVQFVENVNIITKDNLFITLKAYKDITLWKGYICARFNFSDGTSEPVTVSPYGYFLAFLRPPYDTYILPADDKKNQMRWNKFFHINIPD